jgi:hypothetical protein
MPGRKHMSLFAALIIAGLLLVSLLLTFASFLVHQADARTLRADQNQTGKLFYTIPITTPTPTPPPVFSATLLITPSRSTLSVGETLTVTVGISVSEGCEFLTFDLALTEVPAGQPAFTYVNPPTGTVGPPVNLPFTYTLQATQPGESYFSGRSFGERYCGDYYNFTYVTGTSTFVHVAAPYRSYLPLVLLPIPD